eukprot:Lithocolla_globosa_v1_NODE_11830_length_480_cov_4.120000.p2 type:complete len:103 gc:universal NODE_11830_length_480_cov_4.120000:366-58(-)
MLEPPFRRLRVGRGGPSGFATILPKTQRVRNVPKGHETWIPKTLGIRKLGISFLHFLSSSPSLVIIQFYIPSPRTFSFDFFFTFSFIHILFLRFHIYLGPLS